VSTQVGQVTALSICERSHSFASGTDAGNVHIVRVDCASSATPSEGYGGGARRSFGGLSTVKPRNFHIDLTSPCPFSTQTHKHTITQSHNQIITQTHKHTNTQTHKHTNTKVH
jgi:hypothetical protein